MKYDVAILGGGPGGYEAAIRCTQLGLKTALIEARELGGTCLNRGCIPTKALLHSAEVYETALEAGIHGVSTGDVSFDYAAMAAHKDSVVGNLRSGIGVLQKKHGVTVINGFGVLKDAHTLQVGDTLVEAERIILATGSAPSRPPIPGLEGENVLTSDEVLALTACPESMTIIGGGVIGIEFATLYAALGKKVTVLEMMPSILPGVDRDIVQQISLVLEQKGIEIITGAQVLSIQGGASVTVNYSLNGVDASVTRACCVVCVGRSPQTGKLGLEELGVRMERGFVVVDDRMCTSIPSIYAIGDITGKIQLAHVATAQGMVAAANCAGRNEIMDYRIVPSCIYTSPEIASVGMTAEQAEAAGKTVKTGFFDVTSNGKAMVMGTPVGMVKLVTDAQTGEIFGAQILAPRATDMIGEVAALMKSEGTVDELAATIHPHPTICEALMEAAHDVHGLCCNALPKK